MAAHKKATRGDALPLFFHREDGRYGELSQWYLCRFVVSRVHIAALVNQPVSSFPPQAGNDKGDARETGHGDGDGDYITFVTAEQMMMFCKAVCFRDRDTAAQILETRNPRDQKALGRAVAGFDEAAWDAVKTTVVAAASLAKFGQDARLRALLLSTGARELVEASPNDRVWGIGFSEKEAGAMASRREWGHNLLGRALVAARETLRALP